jgi:hypothetical protein
MVFRLSVKSVPGDTGVVGIPCCCKNVAKFWAKFWAEFIVVDVPNFVVDIADFVVAVAKFAVADFPIELLFGEFHAPSR